MLLHPLGLPLLKRGLIVPQDHIIVLLNSIKIMVSTDVANESYSVLYLGDLFKQCSCHLRTNLIENILIVKLILVNLKHANDQNVFVEREPAVRAAPAGRRIRLPRNPQQHSPLCRRPGDR